MSIKVEALEAEIAVLREANKNLTLQNENLRKRFFGLTRSIKEHPAGGKGE
jgi:regulator of replication initiation timing